MTAVVLSSSCGIAGNLLSRRKKEKPTVEKTYESNGVSFSYPEGWLFVEDKISEKSTRNIILGDAPYCLVNIKVFSADKFFDLRQYAENTERQKRTRSAVGKISEARFETVSRNFQEQAHEGVRVSSATEVFGATVPNITDYFLVEKQGSRAVITMSAANEDWKASDKEFQLILDTLKFE